MSGPAAHCEQCGLPEPHTYTEHLAALGRPIRIEKMIKRYTEIQALMEELTREKEDILDDLRSYGEGDYTSPVGTVKVRPPNRKFDVLKAVQYIAPTQRDAYLVVKWDEKLIKGDLTPEQVEECMEPGTGKGRVIFDV